MLIETIPKFFPSPSYTLYPFEFQHLYDPLSPLNKVYTYSASQLDSSFLCLLLQLTDFGLSKVGLINSTDDLSGPAVSGTSLLGEDESNVFTSEDQRERRKKRSAVGTPDYLAPEILLGTGHGSYCPIYMFKVV